MNPPKFAALPLQKESIAADDAHLNPDTADVEAVVTRNSMPVV
jgi:hypothetical protein